MANWAWPHTPNSSHARLKLVGGPFDGEEAGFLPPDLTAPAQIVWGGWFPWGFSAYLYEWRGDTAMEHGRTEALIYRPPVSQGAYPHPHVSWGRRFGPEEIPPVMAESAELWADTAARIADAFDVPAEMLWPGV